MKVQRGSNIELLRIVAMFMIVLHHYCVNAGFFEIIDLHHITANTLLIQFMSIGGKAGVNIFFLISGFFMINSCMKREKVFKLVLQILFYNIIVYLFLTFLGYHYSWKDYLDIIPFIFSMPTSFIGNYLMIYLLSPVINKTLRTLTRQEFHLLLGVLFLYFVILSSFCRQETWHYLGWAFTMYCTGAYIRLFNINKLRFPYGKLALFSLLLIWGIILLVDFVGIKYGFENWSFFIFNANKITMFILGLTIFLFFLNLRLRYNRIINLIGGAVFGVLLLHANNRLMRQWLWYDFLDNTSYYSTSYLWIHMLVSVILIYIVCTLIELLRQKYLEDKFFPKINQVIDTLLKRIHYLITCKNIKA